ncbi:MAG: hypothetical protein CM15mP49_10660 [Actinomycetota bacterium]|nr:MAG: hypothetical protein CM15mP49_10660 [Actinomycetota bacterium]
MFETMMDSVSEDFVKYVSHIEISDNPKTDNEKNTLDQSQNVQYSGTDEIASGALAAISSNKAAGASWIMRLPSSKRTNQLNKRL